MMLARCNIIWFELFELAGPEIGFFTTQLVATERVVWAADSLKTSEQSCLLHAAHLKNCLANKPTWDSKLRK